MAELTIEQRAERAYRAALAYSEDGDIESAIIDLTTDLLHLAPQYGLDTDELQRISRHHYNAEVNQRRVATGR